MFSRTIWQLFFLCLLLSACQSGDQGSPDQASKAKTEAVAAQHLERDQTPPPAISGNSCSASLLPEALTTNGDARVCLFNCQGAVSYRWQVNGKLLANETGKVLSSSYFEKGDQVAVEIDCQGQTLSASALVANSPPKIDAVEFVNQPIVTGKAILVQPVANDPDGDEIEFRYRWVIDGEEVYSVDGPELPGELVRKGTEIALDVFPSDDLAEGPMFSGAAFTVPNAAPHFATQPTAVFQDQVYRYASRGEDPDGDPLTYHLEEGPEGMTIDAQSGELSWSLEAVQAGEYRVSILVEDPEGMQARQTYTINLKPQE